ncbi:MAG: glutathione synthase [Alphaproteobacteria bacterium]|nr:glutathione synthase [Alphaproteobacteria bacterium]
MKKVAFQMDPPSRLNVKTDTTLMLAEEAQKRGYDCYYYTPDDLSWREGEVLATLRPMDVDTEHQHFCELGEGSFESLNGFDVIWMRQDPPFDLSYISATHILEHLPKPTRVLNDPKGVRESPEKLSPLFFKEFMPPTLISRDINAIRSFAQDHSMIVAKPLYGFGGRSVFKLSVDDPNIITLLEHWTESSREPLMWQAFLPEVNKEDRRIILVDGEIAAVFGRVPHKGSIRANMRVGGEAVAASLTRQQEKICNAIRPYLKEHGLLLVGLDVIGDYLTEINVTSPTGLRAVEKLYGENLAAKVWDKVEGS